jgi:hypothetical protein
MCVVKDNTFEGKKEYMLLKLLSDTSNLMEESSK